MPETLGSRPHKAKVGYFVGCTATYRDKVLADSTLSILKKLGEDFTLIDEVCCGSVLQRIGVAEEEVERLWERNVREHPFPGRGEGHLLLRWLLPHVQGGVS